MGLVKRELPSQKPARAAPSKRAEDLSLEGWSDDLAMRRRLCDFMIGLCTLGVVFAGALIALHGAGVLLLPTAVLTALVIVVFGAAPRMLCKIVQAAFLQK